MERGPRGAQFITLQEDAALFKRDAAECGSPTTFYPVETSTWGPTSSKGCLSLSDPTVGMLVGRSRENLNLRHGGREPDPSSERGAPQKPEVTQKVFGAAFPFLYYISPARPLRARGHVFISV